MVASRLSRALALWLAVEGLACLLILGVVVTLLPAIEAVYVSRLPAAALLAAPCGLLAAMLVWRAWRIPASLLRNSGRG
jgi:C4-dicarboxylate transporter